MARKRLSKSIENTILLNCRRRCCICFGLHRDTQIKKGQIAHLDRNPNNNKIENLAYFCLEHHDEYDSKTSQSKNLTIHEVVSFRNELEDAIGQIWKQPFTINTISNIDGHYIRDGIIDSSELEIATVNERIIRVSGIALWGKIDDRGPNIGTLDFESQLINGELEFMDKRQDGIYHLTITFEQNRIIVKEKNFPGYFGLNVSFEGEYIKTTNNSTT